ncbi:hypothetical protein A1A1_08144 [Planococcus antarcticus DSM 14505]|uniref:Uncharacterized protein n=1 Tax=Planococcus antarcticus DSM 14505 TaxID=1185653 RepID=A0AA87IMJ3_9BACL|nr:hypothetical protein A1A1_08144 [Planococcus antarcticus DSM 14505]
MIFGMFHLVPTDGNWKMILVHENSRYQSHIFSNQHSLLITRMPSWFEEGIADYFTSESSGWYNLGDIRLIDFHDLDSQQDFDTSATDVYDSYAQSFLTVESLVEAHGQDIIPDLLMSRSTNIYCEKTEYSICIGIEEYKATFLEQMIVQ